MDEYSIKVYTIDPEKHEGVVKRIQRSRLVWYPILVISFFFGIFWESIEFGEIHLFALFIFFSSAISLGVFAYFYVTKMFSKVKIEMSFDELVAVEVKQVKIWMDRVTFVREKKNGLWIEAFRLLNLTRKRIVIPNSIENYEELKSLILDRVDLTQMEWYRLPMFWVLFSYVIFSIITIPIFGSFDFLAIGLVLSINYLVIKFVFE